MLNIPHKETLVFSSTEIFIFFKYTPNQMAGLFNVQCFAESYSPTVQSVHSVSG